MRVVLPLLLGLGLTWADLARGVSSDLGRAHTPSATAPETLLSDTNENHASEAEDGPDGRDGDADLAGDTTPRSRPREQQAGGRASQSDLTGSPGNEGSDPKDGPALAPTLLPRWPGARLDMTYDVKSQLAPQTRASLEAFAVSPPRWPGRAASGRSRAACAARAVCAVFLLRMPLCALSPRSARGGRCLHGPRSPVSRATAGTLDAVG